MTRSCLPAVSQASPNTPFFKLAIFSHPPGLDSLSTAASLPSSLSQVQVGGVDLCCQDLKKPHKPRPHYHVIRTSEDSSSRQVMNSFISMPERSHHPARILHGQVQPPSQGPPRPSPAEGAAGPSGAKGEPTRNELTLFKSSISLLSLNGRTDGPRPNFREAPLSPKASSQGCLDLGLPCQACTTQAWQDPC